MGGDSGNAGKMRKLAVTLGEIAQKMQAELVGDARKIIRGVAPLTEAGPEDLTYAEDRRYLAQVQPGQPGAVVVARGEAEAASTLGVPLLLVDHPRLAFNRVLALFAPDPELVPGIHPTAVLGRDVNLGEGVVVGAHTVIGNRVRVGPRTVVYPGVYIGNDVEIGPDCLLYPRVVIREEVRLGARVIIGPGSVIGSDGFGFVTVAGRHHKVPQIGTVIIEDDVEIGANVTVDRATMGATRIGRGTKVDNLVQIAHNVEIGEDVLVVSQVGIAGSARISDRVILAGKAGVAGHLTIGVGAVVMAGGIVAGDLPPGARVSGIPARPHVEELKAHAALLQLPEDRKRLRELEKRVKALEAARK